MKTQKPKMQNRTINKYKQLLRLAVGGMELCSMNDSKEDVAGYKHHKKEALKYAKLLGVEDGTYLPPPHV